MWKRYDEKAVKEICYDCDSKSARQSYNYFRRANYRAVQAKSTVWCELLYDGENPIGMYYAYKCRDHARLIEIAVRTAYKGLGIGREVLYRLLSRMKAAGLYKLTFRTPIAEEAQYFWLHIGARIVDVKGDDYEMELTIKQE